MSEHKKKVLYFITKSNWGGAQKYVYQLATANRDSYDVVVALGGNGKLAQKLEKAHIRVIYIESLERDISIFKELRSFLTIWHIVQREKPDILHINSSKAGGLGALVGRLCHISRIIFTAHGWAFNENRSFISKGIIKSIYWIIIALSHSTIAVSETTRNQIRSFPFVQRKIVVIRNGIGSIHFVDKATARTHLVHLNGELKDICARNPHYPWIGTIAELHPIKGHLYALEAIAKLRGAGKDVIFVLIGDGELKAKLEEKIQELNLASHVFLLGHVDNAAQYLKAFDIFLLSSLSEALAYVILEAGQAQLPVVATNVGGIPEIIHHERNGFLAEPQDPESLKNGLQMYLDQPEKAAEYAKNLLATVEQQFSLSRMIKQTKTAYESMNSSSRSPRGTATL